MSLKIEKRALEIATKLIAINSENPPGNEEPVVACVSSILGGVGCEIQLIETAPGRLNIIATAKGRAPGPTIILNGHLDTKPARHSQTGTKSWRYDPFEPTLSKGRLYGLGACDTKGSVAAQLAAFIGFLERNRRWNGTVIFQGVADEENGSVFGTQALFERNMLAADFAIVGEPTGGLIATAQLGNLWAEVRVQGISSHAGMPWRGTDAIRIARSFADKVDRQLVRWPRDPRFRTHPVLNIGRIEGGDHPGTVPGACTLQCAIRPLPGQKTQDYLVLLARVAREVAAETGAAIEVNPLAGGGLEPNEVDRNHPMVQALARAGTSFGGSEETGVFFGASDAQFFGRAGTPAVVLGPGSLEQAHAPNEFVAVSQLKQVATRLMGFLQAVLR